MLLCPSWVRLFALAASITVAVPSFAAWPHDPNEENVPICVQPLSNQTNPVTVTDGAGGAIIAWLDNRSGMTDVYAQRVDAAGQVLWTNHGVQVVQGGTAKTNLLMVADGAGGAVLAWIHDPLSTSDVHAQRIDGLGARMWGSSGVPVCTEVNQQVEPSLGSDGAGGAIIAWTDFRSAPDFTVYVQRVGQAGSPMWTADGQIAAAGGLSQQLPQVVADGAGGAIVCWTDGRPGTNGGDIYGQHLDALGVPLWASSGLALGVAALTQTEAKIVSDGSGGAVLTWLDFRSGTNYDLYAGRVSGAGARLWGVAGVAINTNPYMPNHVQLAPDGSHGAIITWDDDRYGDGDLLAQRVAANGSTLWGPGGVEVTALSGQQLSPQMVSDGAGGAIITWNDSRGISFDIYAQRVDAAGNPQWLTNGAPLCRAVQSQNLPTLASDGAGGAIVSWYDGRDAVNTHIYAQRVERFGVLGSPEPVIVKVKDVPNDEGGRVSLQWIRSWLDELGGPVSAYWIWRQVPAALAEARLARGARLLAREDKRPSVGTLWRESVVASYFWEFVASRPAAGSEGYSYSAETLGDSVAASNPHTHFMVQARQNDFASGFYWNSAPDSGYSVDNLAPPAPAPFTGNYATGSTTLFWGANPAGDFAEYRLHRGVSPGFVPGPANFVVAKPDPGYVDGAGQPYFYKLAAVDVHGNVSAYAFLHPAGTTAVGDEPAASIAFALDAIAPNPIRGSRLSVGFALPRTGGAKLELVDVAGRLVASRDLASLGAGRHTASLAAGRRLAPGVYLVRLAQGGGVRVRRVSVLE